MPDAPLEANQSKVKSYELNEFVEEGEVEDHYMYDYSFVTYTPNSFLMQHRSYAGTQLLFISVLFLSRFSLSLHLEAINSKKSMLRTWL